MTEHTIESRFCSGLGVDVRACGKQSRTRAQQRNANIAKLFTSEAMRDLANSIANTRCIRFKFSIQIDCNYGIDLHATCKHNGRCICA